MDHARAGEETDAQDAARDLMIAAVKVPFPEPTR
jgi:hypothetical protein